MVINGLTYAHVSLHVPGAHNISNALAAASAAYVLGLPGEAVTAGLASFTGAGRRFEHKGTFRGAEVYDDYAHHPDEVRALLSAAQALPHKRLILAFQPHTYTRTAALFDDFVEVLRLPDRVVLAEIYAPGKRTTSASPPGTWPPASPAPSTAPRWSRRRTSWKSWPSPAI